MRSEVVAYAFVNVSVQEGYKPFAYAHSFCVMRESDGDKVIFHDAYDMALTMTSFCIEDDSKKDALVPIVAVSGLGKLIYPLVNEFHKLGYQMACLAKNRADLMTFDLLSVNGRVLLRFWDCSCFLEREDRGLNLENKPYGEPLGEDEREDCKHVLESMRSCMGRLLWDNRLFIWSTDLGTKLITKTSLTRLYAKRVLGNLKFVNSHGAKVSVHHSFMQTCKQQFFKDCGEWRAARASFNGGFTFTNALQAGKVLENVYNADVCSMHHVFLNGRYFPRDFSKLDSRVADRWAKCVLEIGKEDLLGRYHKPFFQAFNAKVSFTNIRIREGSAFECWQIGLVTQSKFRNTVKLGTEIGINERAKVTEDSIRNEGYRNFCVNGVFSFGKLMSADEAFVWVDENELWSMSRVYEWDSMHVCEAYGSCNWIAPPDYITLQSNMLYKEKDDCKRAIHTISDDFEKAKLQDYYVNTVKAKFNSIYGTQVQETMKPDFIVCSTGLEIDEYDIPNNDNFDQLKPKKPSSLFYLGSRVSSAARMHLVLAIEQIFEELGDRCCVLSGDTDSLYIKASEDVNATDIELCLNNVLHFSAQKAIDKTLKRMRECFPMQVADLSNVGRFEVEEKPFKKHYEFMPKARISMLDDGKSKVTLSGMPKELYGWDYEMFAQFMIEVHGFDKVVPKIMNYNTYVNKDISNTVCVYVPSFTMTAEIGDCLGFPHIVPLTICESRESVILGSDFKIDNEASLCYMKDVLGRTIFENTESAIEFRGDYPSLLFRCDDGKMHMLGFSDEEEILE